MTVLDTFYILFKTNSEDVKKGMTEVEKKSKETEKSLRNSNEEASKLGQSFVKMVEGGAALAGAYAGFALIKNGVLNQIDYNKQLYVTSQLLGQHAGQLKQMAQASAQAGGTREGALADMTALATLARQRNAVYDPAAHMARVRALYQAQHSAMSRQNVLDNSGFNDQGLRMQAAMSDAEFAKLQSSSSANSKLSDADARKAFEANAAKESITGSIGNLDTTIATGLIPTIDRWIDKITGFTNSSSGSVGGAIGLAGAFIGAKALSWGVGAKGALRLLGLGAAAEGTTAAAGTAAAANLGGASFVGAGAAGIGAGGAAVAAGSLAGGIALGYYIVDKLSNPIERLITKWEERDLPNTTVKNTTIIQGSNGYPMSLAASVKTNAADMDFWMKKGYSKEQAAGILANIQAESGGNPGAIGDNGQARGIAQWHPDRRAAILKGTGIDVWSASRDQQMEAMAWEMNGQRAGFNDQYYRSLKDPARAGGYFSNQFESPADKVGNYMSRGQSALALASQYQGGGASTTVSIDKIEIHTKATTADDIAAHIKTAVIGSCSDIQSKADNGRAG